MNELDKAVYHECEIKITLSQVGQVISLPEQIQALAMETMERSVNIWSVLNSNSLAVVFLSFPPKRVRK